MTARPQADALGQRYEAGPRRRSRAVENLLFLIKHPQGAAGLVIVLALLILAIAAPVLSWHAPNEQFSGHRLESPSTRFLIGTDEFSRDLWARVLYGLRVSLTVGFGAVFLGAIIGSVVGMLAGFVGSWIDASLSRLTDAMLAFPAVVAAIGIATALGPGNSSVAIAIALFNVPLFARLARASTLVEREKDYVLAATAVGAPRLRILVRHVVPNAVAPLFVQIAFSVSFAVLLEAGLSFLGLGTQPPDPSIGGMLNASRTYMRDAPFYAILPGLVIVFLLVGMNLLADALNEMADPRLRQR
jgi:peptide/nickel transport system permease protein